MKLLALCATLLLTTALWSQHPATKADEDAIRTTIKDYIEGYYNAEPDRVKRALHPKMAKRVVGKDKEGKSVLGEGTTEHMIEMTAAKDGPKYYPKEKQKCEITIYEHTTKIATAKAVATDWIDYIHLAKLDGQWVIVNVMWE